MPEKKATVVQAPQILSGLIEPEVSAAPGNITPTKAATGFAGITKQLPTTTTSSYSIKLDYAPTEITEGDNAAFTWRVAGPPVTIHTSTIYYGKTSTPQVLTEQAAPSDTNYTTAIKDFIQGNYIIPLIFTGNAIYSSPGTYYFRAYAYIMGKHYWTPEQTLNIKPGPLHQIKIETPPTTINTGESAAFTWDIYGPAAKTGYTAIVGSRESRSGKLDTNIDITQTPYKVLVKEFITGIYDIPLRFIGNATFVETGKYYFRALAIINDKNIWSPEYSFEVK